MIRSKQIDRPQVVLVVDDQEINRDALGVTLEDYYEVIYAENGKEALELMNEHFDELSIVLLDLMMPVMNGYEVLERVKDDEQLKRIPIIVLTSEKSAELKALQLGAADFIPKPFDIHEVIIARVRRIIELSEGKKLISAAEHDHLTGLYNRSFFFEYVNRVYLYHKDMKMDALVINIEQFHAINAMNGREFGDDVLKAIGEGINEFLSEHNGIGSRTHADHFDIYCEHQDDYQPLHEKIQDKANALSPNVRIYTRMGVMPYSEGVDPVTMFDRARAACNMARGDYQHPVIVYDEKLLQKEMLDIRLLNDLDKAIEEKQFKVYYQPKYDIQCDHPRLRSAEALVRWQHPELGMISPGDFIPLFEGNGLINKVDSYVWKEASRQCSEWKKKYNYTLPISMNVSRADVYDFSLVERLKKLMDDNHLDCNSIKLEMTESAYTDDAKRVLEVINQLRALGFEIEMDDFGSGYSSLNMLSQMPIDVLKMDMKFVRNIEESETDLRLVKLILDIARYLGLTVVAEGVETGGQLKLLKDAGCNLVQGFYFSKAVKPEEFALMIEKEIEERKQNDD